MEKTKFPTAETPAEEPSGPLGHETFFILVAATGKRVPTRSAPLALIKQKLAESQAQMQLSSQALNNALTDIQIQSRVMGILQFELDRRARTVTAVAPGDLPQNVKNALSTH
jgi:hypothetical protein